MSEGIECPHCGESFDVSVQMKANIEKSVRSKITSQVRDEMESTYKQRLNERLESKDNELEHLQKSLKQLKSESKELKNAKRNLEKLKEEQEDLIEDEVRKARREEKKRLKAELEERISERLKEGLGDKEITIKELEISLERQAKKIQELQDAASRSHSELQGESLEKAALETLSNLYPLDALNEISKGAYGADIEQFVRTKLGSTAGKILYECKFVKNWKDEWINKIRSDGTGFDILVVVSTVLPEGMETFGKIDDVFVCRFHELEVVSNLLRFALLKTDSLKTIEEHKESIQERVANYISGPEFSFVLENIMKAYTEIEDSIRMEEGYMKKQWKARRHRLQTVVDSIAKMLGTLDAIGGAQFNLPDLPRFERPQLEGPEND